MNVCRQISMILLAGAVFAVSAPAQWIKIGGEPAGAILSLTERDSLLVAGSQSGRVTVSSDFGTTWYNRSTNLSGEEISSVVFYGGTLFAGTRGEGVFRSTDDGLTWTEESSGLASQDIRVLEVHDGVIYAGTSGAGVYRSTDGGVTWEARNGGLTNNTVLSMTVKGSDLYIGTYGGGVFRSTNEGAQWIWAGSGLTNLYIPSVAARGDTLYAGSWGGGMFQSTTGGATWTPLAGEPYSTVWAIRADAGGLYASTAEGFFWRSSDGVGWSDLSNGWSVRDARCVERVKTALCVGTAVGNVMISTDGGGSWTAHNPVTLPTLVNVVTVQLDSNENRTSVVFAGGENGLYRSQDNGDTWTMVNRPPGPDSSIWAIAARSSQLFVEVSGTLYVSTNGGNTWTASGPRGQNQIIRLQGANVLVGTSSAAYYSSNNGITWTPPALYDFVYSVAIAPPGSWGREGITLFAGLSELYSSVDSGKTWQITGLSSVAVRSLVLVPHRGTPGAIDLVASTPYEVRRSTDAGVTWTDASRGLPYATVYTLSAYDGILFAGTEQGVYCMADPGDHWVLLGDNPPPYGYNYSLDVNGQNVYAVYDGLWRYHWEGQSTSVEPIEDPTGMGFCLLRSFPNPFNPTTTITFTVPQPAQITLAIYNALGEHVTTLVAGELPPGTYVRRWTASGLASGVYFCSLEAAWEGKSYRETTKLIVLR